LVLQLQHLAQKADSDIEELLRRSILVATKLNLEDFEQWCRQELFGYSGNYENLPSYRKKRGTLYVRNPYHGLQPLYLSDEKTNELITRADFSQSVGELAILSAGGGYLEKQLPNAAIDFLLEVQGNYPSPPVLKVDKALTKSVLTHVRNKIYDWSVTLERAGVLGEGMQFTKEEKEKAMSNTTYNIGNMQGVAGHVQDSSVTQTNQMIVNQMDITTLLTTLKNVGISERDLNELQQAITDDEKPVAKNNFGERVSKWYGRMITKAADGTWEIGVAVAANLLTESLNSFYGLS
jgi:hypothetical protein